MTLLLVGWQDLKRSCRDPVGVLMMLAVPLALIVAIGLVAGHAPFGRAPDNGFDALSYVAPGMALFFMMFSVRQAARTTAEDAVRGVSDRLRASPASDAGIRAGAMVSHVVLLFLQLAALVGISTLMYGLWWGPTGPVLLVCLVVAVTAGGWVALLAVLGRTPNRINALGTALTLIFGIVSRSFAAVIPTTPWMDGLARITPNYWGLHAFSALAMGGGLGSILRDCGALAVMCVALWLVVFITGALTPGRR
jgi:ABC-2 type transport system permease protein